jgi:uncharacterized membrane protein
VPPATIPGVTVHEFVDAVGRGVDLAGVAAIVLGAAIATVVFVAGVTGRRGVEDPFQSYRQNLGRGILLGLELLVAGDIIRTVAVTPTFSSLGVLAGIILIRTFLSFSLQYELEHRGRGAR